MPVDSPVAVAAWFIELDACNDLALNYLVRPIVTQYPLLACPFREQRAASREQRAASSEHRAQSTEQSENGAVRIGCSQRMVQPEHGCS